MSADVAGLSLEPSRPLARRLDVPALTVGAAAIVLAVVVMVFLGRWITPHNPDVQNLAFGARGPGGGHWLGTDSLGRDVLSRLIVGAEPALLGPVCVAIGATAIGSSLGLLAGYSGGVADAVLNRYADLVYALPALLVSVVLVGVLNGGYWMAVAILVFLSTPSQLRIARSATMVQVRLPYVDAARTLGISGIRTMTRHILPNITPTVVTMFLLEFVGALIGFSGLAYLGLGVQPTSAAWGSMLNQGQPLIAVNPWLSLAPAIMIVLTAASITLIGDWAFDRLSQRHEHS